MTNEQRALCAHLICVADKSISNWVDLHFEGGQYAEDIDFNDRFCIVNLPGELTTVYIVGYGANGECYDDGWKTLSCKIGEYHPVLEKGLTDEMKATIDDYLLKKAREVLKKFTTLLENNDEQS